MSTSPAQANLRDNKNSKPTHFVLTVGGAFLIFFAGIIVSVLGTGFGGHSSQDFVKLGIWITTAGFFALLVHLALRIWRGVVFTQHAIDIRGQTTAIQPISPTPESFDVCALTPVDRDLPTIRGEWLSISEDAKTLQVYAEFLDEKRNEINSQVRSAIERFNKDRLTLLDQQKSVLRRAFQAKSVIARFKDLPKVALSVSNLPQFERLSVPASPAFLTAEQYAKKYAPIPKNAGFALSRLLTINGGGVNGANLVALLIGAGIMAVRAKGLISKSLRALEDSRGQVNELCAEARSTMHLLETSHLEITAASLRMRQVFDEIEALTDKATKLPSSIKTLEEVTPQQQEDTKRLWYWVLSADQVSRTDI